MLERAGDEFPMARADGELRRVDPVNRAVAAAIGIDKLVVQGQIPAKTRHFHLWRQRGPYPDLVEMAWTQSKPIFVHEAVTPATIAIFHIDFVEAVTASWEFYLRSRLTELDELVVIVQKNKPVDELALDLQSARVAARLGGAPLLKGQRAASRHAQPRGKQPAEAADGMCFAHGSEIRLQWGSVVQTYSD